MATRVVVAGRTVWADREWVVESSRRPAHLALPRDRSGMPVDLSPIAADDPRSPFREGEVFYDADEEVYYHQIAVLDPRNGWATSAFWQDRWKLEHGQIIQLARAGLLDAAVASGSQVRKYRCRDERQVINSDLFRRWYRKRPRSHRPRLLKSLTT